MFEAFFFRENRLFGCYHPSAKHDASKMLVICPPFFDEYRRSYKALADLANACAEQGVHILRFDFFGTGESQGTLNQASIGEWKNDIEAAINEGIAVSGASDIILLALRFSATIACKIKQKSIKRYIFWDPIDSGAEYLEWLDHVNQCLRRQHQQDAREYNIPFQEIEYSNFELTPKIKQEMVKIKFDFARIKEKEVYVITTDPSVCDTKRYANCEYAGLKYEWPAYHDGILNHKPVLEAIARRILS